MDGSQQNGDVDHSRPVRVLGLLTGPFLKSQ
jgi:hypothetical protein